VNWLSNVNRLSKKILFVVSVAFLLPGTALADGLKLKHADAAWGDGTGGVPGKGICKRRGGEGLAPSVEISGLPDGTTKVTLHFTDENWGSEGAHGVIGYSVPAGSGSVVVPSFAGETDDLPTGIEKIGAHQCYDCGGGVYLGPCSGGRGHAYTVYVYARDADGNKLAKGKLGLGNY